MKAYTSLTWAWHKIDNLELELAEAKKELKDYKAVTKLILDKLQSQLPKGERIVLTTPQWLQKCPLEPIQPIDMKTICIGEIWLLWTSMETDQMIEEMKAKILVYTEVDDYFKEGNYV